MYRCTETATNDHMLTSSFKTVAHPGIVENFPSTSGTWDATGNQMMEAYVRRSIYACLLFCCPHGSYVVVCFVFCVQASSPQCYRHTMGSCRFKAQALNFGARFLTADIRRVHLTSEPYYLNTTDGHTIWFKVCVHQHTSAQQ